MNAELLIQLLRIGTQLINTLNQIKAQAEASDPALWARIADDYNAAVAAFLTTTTPKE